MPVEIVELALKHQRELEAFNLTVTEQMANKWWQINVGLSNKVDSVIDEIRLLQSQGKPITQAWLNELSYYKQLQEQAENAWRNYSGWAEQYTQKSLLETVNIGIDDATGLLNASGRMDYGYFRRLPKEQIEAIQSLLQEGAPLDRLFQSIIPGRGTNIIGNALMQGFSMGMPMREVAKLITDAASLPYKRSLVIARTEINWAHRTATLRTFQEYGVVSKWKRLASKRHSCMACLLLDGTVYSSQTALEDHPNGGCTMVPWVDGAPEPEWEYGKDYFQKLSPEEQQARMGKGYYEAWKHGDFKLDDLVTIHHNRVWGNSPSVLPLKDLSPNWKSYIYGTPKNDEAILQYLKANEMVSGGGYEQSYKQVAEKTRELFGKPVRSPEIDAWIKEPNIWYGRGRDNTIHPLGESLQKQILSGKLPSDQILYRGDSLSKFVGVKPNEVIELSQFTSTSTSRAVAEIFTKGNWQDEAMLILQAPKGLPALFVDDSALEILLPAKTKLKVLGRVGNKIYGVLVK